MTETPKEAARRLTEKQRAEGYKPIALHEYQTGDGASLYWRIRLEHPDRKKFIRPMHINGRGFVLGEPGFPDGKKPLYRLPDIARDTASTVWVVEGEKCADTLTKLGMVATTSGSADSAAKADWAPLKGRHVVVWPDADEPGLRYAEAVTAALRAEGAAKIELVDIRGLNLPEGGDIVDWLTQNPSATAADVEKLPRVLGADTRSDIEAAPEPLRAPMPDAEPYPVEALGDVLGGAVRALQRVTRAPQALCAQSVLGAASFAAQPHFNVALPWGEVRPLSLFLLTVGESGERKSAVDEIVLRKAKEREKADVATYEQQAKTLDEGKEKPEPPLLGIRFVSDPTAEGLFKLFDKGQPSVALFSDEGGLLVGGHALNNDNALRSMARWCKLWDGAPFDRVRGGDGAGILFGRRMALHLLAQPVVMARLLTDPTANGQGFLARCLVAWPATAIGTRFIKEFKKPADAPELVLFHSALQKLFDKKPSMADGTRQELAPIALQLSEAARGLAVDAANKFEALMATGGDLAELRDRTAKALENACRIAGVLAAAENRLSAQHIEREHLERGLILVQWYLAEALRIRAVSVVPQSVTDAEALSRWLQERNLSVFRSSPVLTHGPSQLRNKERLMAAIKVLVGAGYLGECPAGTKVDGVTVRKAWKVLHYVV